METAVLFVVYDTVKTTDGEQAGGSTYQLYMLAGKRGIVKGIDALLDRIYSQVALRWSFLKIKKSIFFLM